MFELSWIVSGPLIVIAAMDKRSWPLLSVVVLGVLQMLLSEAVLSDRLAEVAMKIPIDLVCGFFALMLATRERWSLMVPALFCVTLLIHAAYWMTRINGVDTWGLYANTLCVLWILTLVTLTMPTGGKIVGLVSDLSSRYRTMGGVRFGRWIEFQGAKALPQRKR